MPARELEWGAWAGARVVGGPRGFHSQQSLASPAPPSPPRALLCCQGIGTFCFPTKWGSRTGWP